VERKGWRKALLRTNITIQIIPDSAAATRSWQLPLWGLLLIPVLLSWFIGTGIFLALQSYYQAQTIEGYQGIVARQWEENQRLVGEQALLEDKYSTLAAQSLEMYRQLAQLDYLGREIVQLAQGRTSTRELALSGMHLGGAEPLPPVEITLARLEEELPQRKAQLSRLQQILREEERRREHTPSLWPVRGRISSNYGWRIHPLTGRRQHHGGLDIAAPVGTAVRASAAGLVTFAGWRSGYGYTVIIRHGDGLETLYAHNSQLKVQAGTRVVKGQIIARVGSSGNSTGPHLHYEVIKDGQRVNPRHFLP
jgi:murein DD-endopeptidase MepM/ murein hydrolase activator NlpD